MAPEQFTELIERGDAAGIVTATRRWTEDQRRPFAGIAAQCFQRFQRLAHLGIDQDLRDKHQVEFREILEFIRNLAERNQTMTLMEASFVAFTAVGSESDLRESLKFYSQTLQQHFFISEKQIEPVLERRLPCFADFFANKKHVEKLQDLFVIPFIAGGILEKQIVPQARYVGCLIYSLLNHPDLATKRRSDIIRGMPEILEEIWQAFDYGYFNQLSFGEVDAYERQKLPFFDSWADTFVQLTAAGHMDRHRLLGQIRKLIARDDFSIPDQNNFIQLHDYLQPTSVEFAKQIAEYLDMLSSRGTHIVKFAIDVLAQLEKAKALDGEAFFRGARAVFEHKPKGHSKQVLTLSEKLVKRQPECVPEAIHLAIDALVHESPEVQMQAVKQLEKWHTRMHPDDVNRLREKLDAVAPSVRGEIENLISKCGSQVVKLTAPSRACEDRPATAPATAVDDGSRAGADSRTVSPAWLDEFALQADALPQPWRQLAGVDEAISAAREGQLPAALSFRLLDVPVLTSCQPIRPIETVDELLDTVAHGIETLDSADELERILDGISRLADQRPPDFERRAAPLLIRLPTNEGAGESVSGGSWSGLASERALGGIGRIVASWLNGKMTRIKKEALGFSRQANRSQGARLEELLGRVLDRRAAPLLSAPTHQHGWIESQRLVERMLEWQSLGMPLPINDLTQALLRLAPDGRSTALAAASAIEGDFGRIVRWTLGSDEAPTSSDERLARLWLAAGRARWPEGAIPALQCIASLNGLPFGAGETKLIWKVASPWDDPTSGVRNEYMLGFDDQQVVAYWEPSCPQDRNRNLLTVTLSDFVHPGRFILSSPAWDRQWLASQWPLNADPYFAAGLTAIRARYDSNPSTIDPNYVFLEPLLEADRVWSAMACVLICLSLTCKEADTRAAALDVLITGIEDGRANGPMLSETWRRMSEWGGLKLNRIADALSEAARVSPLHSWFNAEVAQRLLASLHDWPNDGHYLLSALIEWLTELQQPISDGLRQRLISAKLAGKAVKLSQSLLKLPRSAALSDKSMSAIRMALDSRLARAQRWADGR